MVNKKLISKFLLAGLIISNVSFAQVVTVEGIGVDKDSAVRDAMRNAVEQVVGTFVDSRTLVEKSVVAMDEIFTKSDGFVRNIKIISESVSNNSYQIKANVDVDNNPNSALMNKLSMVMLLNDPRIATVVLCRDGEEEPSKAWRQISESTINGQLISMGFSHVVDSNKVSSEESGIQIPNEHTDYVVLCDLHFQTNDIVLPNFDVFGRVNQGSQLRNNELSNSNEGEQGNLEEQSEVGNASGRTENKPAMNDTGLKRATVVVMSKIIKTDNQDVITQFTITETKLGNTNAYAERLAIEAASKQAAGKIAEAFAKKAANVNISGQIVARVDSYDNALELQKTLESLAGVNKVYMRGYEGGKAKLDIDSSQKLNTIYRMLKDRNTLSIFMENMTENCLEISVN